MYNVCEPYHLAVEIGNIEHNFSWRIFYTEGESKTILGVTGAGGPVRLKTAASVAMDRRYMPKIRRCRVE